MLLFTWMIISSMQAQGFHLSLALALDNRFKISLL